MRVLYYILPLIVSILKTEILKVSLLYLLLISSFVAYAQANTIDSLRKILQTQQEDTNKAYTLNALSGKLSYKGDNANALEYANKAMALAKKLNLKAAVGQSYVALSTVYTNTDNLPESNKNLYLALKLYEEIGDKVHSADCLTWIGFNFYWQQNYQQALSAFFDALRILKEIGSDNFNAAICYIFIANIYRIQKKYREALNNVSTGLEISISKGYKQAAANAYSCMGDILSMQIESGQAVNNNTEQSASLKEALKNYLEALNNFREVHDVGGMADSYQHVSEVNIRLNHFLEAQKYIDSALQIAKQFHRIDNLGKSYLIQAKLDSAQHNYRHAYGHYKLYILYRDSLFNGESIKKSEGYKMQYEFDKKEDQIKLLSTENKLKTALAGREGQRKKMAYIGIGIILFSGGYGFYRYRRRKELQSQQTVLNERLRISRELHDEVGATLSGIAMYSHLTKEQIKTGQTADIEKSLNVMQQSSTQMVNKLSDIVWLINPEQDSLQKLVTRLEEYATDMAAIKNMKVKITIPDKIAEINLPIEDRRSIYLFCKEAINNAVKYSQGSLLELTVKEKDSKLEFSVRDNGKGFDVVMVRRGNGLENMQKRADEIGAKLILQSKLNEGAYLSLQCNITQ